MKQVQILFYRDLLEFKKKYLSFFIMWSLLPMILYLMLVSPLINFFNGETIQVTNSVGIIYDCWSLPGIWFCSSSLFAFIYCFSRLRNLIVEQNQLQKYLKAPLSNGQFLSSILISSIFFSVIQLCISMLITLNLDVEGTGSIVIMDLVIIFSNIFFLIVFFSILGLLLSFYVKDNLSSNLLVFAIFIFIAFSLGAIIPIPIDESNQFFEIIKKLPIYKIVLNTHKVIVLESQLIDITALIITAILNAFLFGVTVILSYKKFRK